MKNSQRPCMKGLVAQGLVNLYSNYKLRARTGLLACQILQILCAETTNIYILLYQRPGHLKAVANLNSRKVNSPYKNI